MKKIDYSHPAKKTLRKMPANQAKRIVAKVEDFAAGRQANVVALKGSENHRIRVGDWRVIVKNSIVVTVIKIGPRGDVYKG